MEPAPKTYYAFHARMGLSAAEYRYAAGDTSHESAPSMKQYLGAALSLLITGCATDHRAMSNLDPYIVLQNIGRPFVSQSLAEKLARAVIEEKYPRTTFLIRGPGKVVDKGDTWWVTFDNSIEATAGGMIPLRLTVHVRKTNGEIVTVSG
jgi:hypothetical protein